MLRFITILLLLCAAALAFPQERPVPLLQYDNHGWSSSFASSADGRCVLTVNFHNLKWWTTDGILLKSAFEEEYCLWKALFSPDNKRIYVLGYNYDSDPAKRNALLIYDSALKRTGRAFLGAKSPASFGLSRDGKYLAVCCYDRIVIFDGGGSVLTQVPVAASCAAISPDDKWIAACDNAGGGPVVKLFDMSGGLVRSFEKSHTGAIKTISFSRDGKTLLTGSADNSVKLWDISGKLRTTLDGGPRAGFDGDDNPVIYGKDGVAILNGNGEAIHKIALPENTVQAELTPDGTGIICMSLDCPLRKLDLNGNKILDFGAPWAGLVDSVSSLAVGLDGRYLALGSYDGRITIYNLADGSAVKIKAFDNYAGPMAFSPDGKFLAACESDWGQERTGASIWSIDGKLKAELKGLVRSATGVAYSPDGKKIIAVSKDGAIRFWDPDGKELNRTGGESGKNGEINSLSVSADGKYFATGNSDRLVHLFDMKGNEIKRFKHPADVSAVSISGDDKYIASGDALGRLLVWDIATGNILSDTDTHKYSINFLQFSPVENILALSSYWETIQVRNTIKLLKTYQEYDDGVVNAQFMRNGKFLATASYNGIIKIWNMKSGGCLTFVNFKDGRNYLLYDDKGRFECDGNSEALLLYSDGSATSKPGDMRDKYFTKGLLARFLGE